jgi:RND family efflux transporter MFP subunit
MTRWKKRGLIFGVCGVVIASAIWASVPRSSGQMFVTETVKRGVLDQTVDVTGELQSVTDLSLAFENTGTITMVSVAVGDTVKKGDLLAELNTAELTASAEQAYQGVLAAQADLEVKLAGMSSEEETAHRAQVAVIEAQVDAAMIDLNTAIISQTVGDAQDTVSVASAQSDDDQVAAQNIEATEQAGENLRASLNASVGTIRSGLESADQVLAVENTLFAIDIKQYLGVLDQNTLTNAKEEYERAAAARDAAEDDVLALSLMSSQDDLLAAYEQASMAMSFVSHTLLYTSRVLDATVSDTRELSNDDLIALRATIASERATVSSTSSSLLSAKQSYDTSMRQANDRFVDATHALALAKAQQAYGVASRAAAVSKAQASLAVQQAGLVKAQADLAAVLADPRDIDLAGSYAAIDRAQAEYDAARARLRKSQILAPIDGVITNVALAVGEQITAGTEMIGAISLDGAYEIVLDVPEADIAKLAIGQNADVTFDAFGDRTVFSGSVYAVDPTETIISDVVFYAVRVVLNPDQDLSMVKPGMSSNVTIYTAHRDDVLFVPTRSILERGGVLYVRVPKSEHEFDEIPVTVGLKADDGFTEIMSGVREGDNVILTIQSK